MQIHSKIILVLLASASLAACGNEESNKSKQADHAATKQYKTMTLERKQLAKEIQLPGVLQPFEFVKIFPKVNGFVKDVYVDRGSKVHKGQVLLRLEAPEVEEHLSAAKLKYSEAKSVFLASKDKYERLLQTSATPGTVSAYDLNTAKAKMMADSATVQGEWANFKAQEDLYNYLTVTAPFDGVITERNIHPGALVGPGTQSTTQPMLVLQQQSKLRLSVSVPEEYSMQIHDGSTVHYHLNAVPGQDFTATISRRSGNLNDKFRSENIEIDVDNSSGKFISGMYAEVTIPAAGTATAFVVPNTAIVTTTERKYIVAVKGRKTKWIDITQGNQSSDSTEVFGTIDVGDRIITNASYEIKEDQPINDTILQNKALATRQVH